jgi:hypothetical protein
MSKIIHYPTLDSILMVEEAIQHMNYPKKTELWKALPKKMMYQTFCLIIDYLETSGKIMIDCDGRVIWTSNPKMIKKIGTSRVILR